MMIDVPENVINNILVFLKRTQMTGEEVPAYMEIMQVLGNRQQSPIDKKEAVSNASK